VKSDGVDERTLEMASSSRPIIVPAEEGPLPVTTSGNNESYSAEDTVSPAHHVVLAWETLATGADKEVDNALDQEVQKKEGPKEPADEAPEEVDEDGYLAGDESDAEEGPEWVSNGEEAIDEDL
jgi:hypothetical protein